MSTAARVAPTFPDSIFRAYDIRGVVPKTLTAETAYWIATLPPHVNITQLEIMPTCQGYGPLIIKRTPPAA